MNIREQFSEYNHYDYNNPEYLAIHYVGAQGSTAKNNADYFCRADRQASAHEFIDDNDCYRVIKEYEGAWHIGNTRTAANNQNSIGLEMCCMGPNLTVTEKTEANTIERALYYVKKYNIPMSKVLTHFDVTAGNKICPNWSANNWDRFVKFKAKLAKALAGVTSTPSTSTSTTNVIYRVKLANGEQIGAFRNLDSAKTLAQTNKCNVYRNTDNALIASYVTNPAVAAKPINYRVKKENGQQLGAFGSIDNAKALAQKNQAIVYNASGSVVISYVPKAGLGYLNLKPHMQSWRVYAVDGPYTSANAVATLAPSKFGGLSYEILEKKATDVYKIKTSSFGIVAIYVPKDGDSSFTSTPEYNN